MTHGQFLNAVALGQVTPGPVVQTVAAVGYAAGGLPDGLLAALVAFAPSFSLRPARRRPLRATARQIERVQSRSSPAPRPPRRARSSARRYRSRLRCRELAVRGAGSRGGRPARAASRRSCQTLLARRRVGTPRPARRADPALRTVRARGVTARAGFTTRSHDRCRLVTKSRTLRRICLLWMDERNRQGR